MRFLLALLLVCAVTCVFFHQDVFTDGSLSDTGHKSLKALEADYNNSEKEQERLQNRIDAYVSERNRYVALANDLKVMGGGKVGSMQTILISALTGSSHKSLAAAVGLTTRAFLSAYGTSSLASAADSAISNANQLHASAEWAYNNTNRTDDDDTYEDGYDRFDSANSAIEAWYENGIAADHHNYHVSPNERLNATDAPNGPTDLNLPWFECPGTCTQEYPTVSEAINAHYEKCDDTAEGNTENVDVYRTMANPEYPFSGQLLVDAVLQSRSVEEGCGRDWYSCDPDHSTNEAYHRVRTCAKGVWATRYRDYTNGKERYRSHTCGDPFRNCMGHTDYHKSSISKDEHSETDDTVSSSNPIASPTPTPTPADGTPNCPDCTTHCSPPCSCTNSGTCNGTVSYHACGQHETSVSGDHSYGTYTCGIHSGYKCQESHDHKTYISSCTQTDSNGNTCTNSSGYYECSQHSHTYPPSLVACGGASYTGCSGASSRTEHHVPSCGNCSNSYWTCSEYAYRHTDVKTCKRSGCGATLTPCQNGPGKCVNGGYHWL